jgi:3-deoxy-D-manno-octulosonic-acid transferase
VPIDTPEATTRFLRHWKPDIGFWVESELWPNLVINARARGCFMMIINGRMSLGSFNSWQKYATLMIYRMLGCFETIFAQSDDDAQRFRSLGGRDVRMLGNLKFDAAPLTCNEEELNELNNNIALRPVWLAASTHKGEEEIIASAHKHLITSNPELLTIIAPRHPERGEEIASLLSTTGKTALRSRNEKITSDTKFYIVDTLGELGLFYRLSEIVFMGGSLVKHGGQNPLEAARLRCCLLTGTNTENFTDIFAEMKKQGICLSVENGAELAKEVATLLANSDTRTRMQMLSKEWLASKGDVAPRILSAIAPIFELAEKR